MLLAMRFRISRSEAASLIHFLSSVFPMLLLMACVRVVSTLHVSRLLVSLILAVMGSLPPCSEIGIGFFNYYFSMTSMYRSNI